METWVVTGGAGFIGCNFVRYALAHTDARIVVVDKLTYAGNFLNVEEVARDPRFHFVQADIANRGAVEAIFREHRPSALVNFAAETHVDRSIDAPRTFIETNVVGVLELLEAARAHLSRLDASERASFRFLHVSTDEVYGSLGPTGAFQETSPYAPRSPYSASKAAADHLVRAYHETYGVPTLITNCSNNYGPFQFPEKLLPLMTLNALEGKPLPLYGDGGNVRDWLYVEDHCAAVVLVLQRGRVGEQYNVGGDNERTNLELVNLLCVTLEKLYPAARNPALLARRIARYEALKEFVADRPGHDRRYAIDASKLRQELDWHPVHALESGLERTLRWYLDHRDWCEAVAAGGYARERLGLGS